VEELPVRESSPGQDDFPVKTPIDSFFYLKISFPAIIPVLFWMSILLTAARGAVPHFPINSDPICFSKKKWRQNHMKKTFLFFILALFSSYILAVHADELDESYSAADAEQVAAKPAAPGAAAPAATQTEAGKPAAQPAEAKPAAPKPAPGFPGLPLWGPRLNKVTPWLSLGGDFRIREEYYDNAVTLNSSAPNHENNYQRYRWRFGGFVQPIKGLEFNFRISSEPRSYSKPDQFDDGLHGDEILFDNLNVTLRNPGGKPITLVIGRQDIAIGNGWLVMDGTPGDGSRTIFFDAARLTYDWKAKKTSFDFIGLTNGSLSNQRIPLLYTPENGNPLLGIPTTFTRFPRTLTEQNENGAIVYVTNKSIPKTQIDGYFMYKHDMKVQANGNNGSYYVFGVRVERDLSNHWRYRAEVAPELGDKNGRDLRAFGANQKLTYFFKNKSNQRVQFGYEYLSGDDPNSKDVNEGFDPLWGRWPQWSELYLYNMAGETRVGEYTNLHRIDFGWGCSLTKKLDLSADYMPLFAASNPWVGRSGYSQTGSFRGHYGQGVMRYKFTDHLSGHLWGEFYLPGSYYAPPKGDNACFLRAELLFRW
jgi:hypothetical protein